MGKKTVLKIVTAALLIAPCCACKKAKDPITLTIWHYYNGMQASAFDTLVSEFNDTVGKDENIYINAMTKGSVAALEKAIADSINEKVGADPMPDIFASYADTAYLARKNDRLADISSYFNSNELEEYITPYIEEGYIDGGNKLYLFPVAKSTEIMMINKTDWDKFANEYNVTYDNLSTIEDLVATSEKYYEYTEKEYKNSDGSTYKLGKALYGRDSMSNYFIVGMKQLGIDLFDSYNGKVTINLDKDKIRRLWDNFYVPFVKGYFAAFGKFRSDDIKTGDVIAYTGSTSSARYFPDKVIEGEEDSSNQRDIDYDLLPTPYFKGGERVNVQQGAGMAVSKSDAKTEKAACTFLKWFTKEDNNIRFSAESSYLPVKKEANTKKCFDKVIKDNNLQVNEIAYNTVNFVFEKYDFDKFYTSKSFDNGYETRAVLDTFLTDIAKENREKVLAKIKEGHSLEEASKPYVEESVFTTWYNDLEKELKTRAGIN